MYEKARQPAVVEKGDDRFKLKQTGTDDGGTTGIKTIRRGDGSETSRSRSFHRPVEIPAASAKMPLPQAAEEVISLLCSDPSATVKATL